ncbi:MAG: helical backbone metal receptor [Bacteroidota bacterium]
MIEVKDQTGNWVRLGSFPKRIICLVPSITELLFDLGLNDEVVGITKFCVHPEHWFKTKPRIGGTKNISFDIIESLSPDLVIANKEENIKEQVLQLEAICPVYVSDVSNLEEAFDMIGQLGKLVGKTGSAEVLLAEIRKEFTMLHPLKQQLKTAYLVWQDPFITVGGDTFINDMLQKCGFNNITAANNRYPTVSITDLCELQCELLLLSSEPYPFSNKHISTIRRQLQSRQIQNSKSIKIELVDGEYFSWYGSRLKMAPKYFRELQKWILSNS